MKINFLNKFLPIRLKLKKLETRWGDKTFLTKLTQWFRRKKKSRPINFGHLVQPVQRFFRF